jgi:hypothetical protein
LRGVFEGYYAGRPEGSVIFDTNRPWSAWASLLASLFQIGASSGCVRKVRAVIDSLERMLRKNPLLSGASSTVGPAARFIPRRDPLEFGEWRHRHGLERA